jgi:hypothetical protein
MFTFLRKESKAKGKKLVKGLGSETVLLAKEILGSENVVSSLEISGSGIKEGKAVARARAARGLT